MEIFIPPLIGLAGVVTIAVVWACRASKRPTTPAERARREEERRRRHERAEERFFRQQSWRYWHDRLGGRRG